MTEENAKKCFTPIQSRRFWASLVEHSVSLCPSMDLMVFGLKDSPFYMHRTVSWQKLASLCSEDDDSKAAWTHATWRPDGRLLCIGDVKGHLYLYHMEAMLSNDTTTSSHIVQFEASAPIEALYWSHVGKLHPAWEPTDLEQDVYWKHRSRYVDQAHTVLPPSEYHNDKDSCAITCKAPLSLLCVATTEQKLDLYLHGRYPVLKGLAFPDIDKSRLQLVSSTDLTHLLLLQPSTQQPSTVTMYSLPALSTHRHDWQTLASLYCSVTSHLEALSQSASEIAASYKSSLKPIDFKLDALQRLLQNYDLSDVPLQAHLVQYILSGNTAQSPNLSNAIDQFFTGVQMNDQLLQRMERSLSVAMANVESQLRKTLLAPAQALVYQVNELEAMSRSAPYLLPPDAAAKVHECAQILLATAELALTELIDARFRFRDLVAWLRSQGSQIKARGTAANSVQRENSQKRRVPDSVVRRMLGYLQQPAEDESGGAGLTETILGLRFYPLLQESEEPVHYRPASPRTVTAASARKTVPTLPYCTQKTKTQVDQLFQHPRTFLAASIRQSSIHLPESSQGIVAMTTRIGSGGIDPEQVAYGEAEPDGFFQASLELDRDCRQWSLLAQADHDDTEGIDAVHLYAIPLSWTDPATDDLDDEDDMSIGIVGSHFGTATLSLPSGYAVCDLGFYGDDGKSSLSSGIDSGTGKEGRQGLGLLVSRDVGETTSLELWLLSYDQIHFDSVSFEMGDNMYSLNVDTTRAESKLSVQTMPESCDEDEPSLAEGVILAKTRQVSTTTDADSCQLLLNGSRGVGAVFSAQSGGTALELLDLEEDEEPEDDDDEDEEMENV